MSGEGDKECPSLPVLKQKEDFPVLLDAVLLAHYVEKPDQLWEDRLLGCREAFLESISLWDFTVVKLFRRPKKDVNRAHQYII